MSVSTLTRAEATQLATEAYTFGFPLILMDVTRAVGTNVPAPAGSKAPMNQIAHVRAFPDYTFTDVVSPNADTLYSVAWMDLTAEPMVLSVPDAGERYYLLQLLDAWSNVFVSLGSRTTGTRAAHFAITRPGWHGSLPPGASNG